MMLALNIGVLVTLAIAIWKAQQGGWLAQHEVNQSLLNLNMILTAKLGEAEQRIAVLESAAGIERPPKPQAVMQ